MMSSYSLFCFTLDRCEVQITSNYTHKKYTDNNTCNKKVIWIIINAISLLVVNTERSNKRNNLYKMHRQQPRKRINAMTRQKKSSNVNSKNICKLNSNKSQKWMRICVNMYNICSKNRKVCEPWTSCIFCVSCKFTSYVIIMMMMILTTRTIMCR